MSRIDVTIFGMVYKIEFTPGTRRYHVHETNLALVLNEKLNCKRDNREEALTSIVSEFSRRVEPSWSYTY